MFDIVTDHPAAVNGFWGLCGAFVKVCVGKSRGDPINRWHIAAQMVTGVSAASLAPQYVGLVLAKFLSPEWLPNEGTYGFIMGVIAMNLIEILIARADKAKQALTGGET